MRSFFAVMLMFWIGFPGLCAAQNTTPEDSVIIGSPRGAMLRSLAVPGWGQYYNDQKTKAMIIGGLQVGSLVGVALADHYAYANFDRSKTYADTPNGHRFRERYEEFKDWKSFFKWWFFLLTLYSAGDAYVGAHLRGFDQQMQVDSKFALTVDPAPDQMKFALQFNF